MLLLLTVFMILIFTLLCLKEYLDIDNFQTFVDIIKNLLFRKQSHWLSNVFQVDEAAEYHGGQMVAAVLKAHRISEIFTLCGGHISPILVAAHSFGIKVYDTRHEVNAVFAADAVARLRQAVGVAVVTAGPGLTNTVTAVKNAQMAQTPVVIIAGAAPTLLKNRGALQDIDQLTLMRPLCKYVTRITRVKDIVPTLRKVICIAQSHTPGPVFVEIPIDILYPYKRVLKEIGAFKEARNLKQKFINTYLLAHISRHFGGAWRMEQDLSPKPVAVTFPKDSDIIKLFSLLKKAEKPVLIVGSQAVLPPVHVDKLREAVEDIGIVTYLIGMSRGLLGHRSSIQMRYNRGEALRDADLIILGGATCDFRFSYGRSFSSNARKVSINRDKSQLLRNEGVFWRADLAIQADVATTLVRLAQLSKSNGYKPPAAVNQWISHLRTKEKKKVVNVELMSEVTDGNGINPLYFLSLVNKVLPEDAIMIADGGDFVGTAAYIVHPRGPLQWLDPGAFGTLGVGAGFALGAKAVYPDRPVVIIYGDGSCGFSLIEFDTFVRHKISVIALIGNDACWSQIAREQISMFQNSVALNLRHTRYDSVGVALGTQGELIANKEDLTEERLKKIFASACGGNSVVVNIVIGKSTFREGSISV